MDFSIFNLLIITGVINGLIFGTVVLLNPKYQSKPNRNITQVAIYLSLNNLYYWLVDTGYSVNISFYEYLYVPWNLLILPFYIYFVVSYLRIELKKGKLFLIPFYVFFLFHVIILINDLVLGGFLNKEIIHLCYYIEEYVSILYTVFLIYKTFELIRKYEKNAVNSLHSDVVISTRWLKQLLIIGVIVCSIWVFLTMYSQYGNLRQFDVIGKYFLWLSISILIYWLGYSVVYHNLVFRQRTDLRNTIAIKEKKTPKTASSLKINEVKDLITKELLFLNPNFSLSLLSEKSNLSEGYLSQLFSDHSEVNFSSYVNKLRISKAKEFLTNPKFKNYTIVSIGLESGFNSKSVFYDAFKKYTGMTPSEYRKMS
ncbi:MAG: helix-turn-helix domain-containing protein [Flavobacteriaceae bacterium]|nr:MAG: helix-turn-helix domain-containing protein [Flavobacteriaceae bacterium]